LFEKNGTIVHVENVVIYIHIGLGMNVEVFGCEGQKMSFRMVGEI
jgi:hypothetical protein